MPINFPQLLQESWNFIRNQAGFTLYGVGLLVALQLLIVYSMPRITAETLAQSSPEDTQILINYMVPTILSALVSVFVNVMLILNIKSINDGHYQHFFQNLGKTLAVIFPVIGITIIQVLPLSLGVSFGGTAGQSGGLAIVALPLMVTGIFVFVKLCLAIYTYLVESPQKTVFESIKFTWGLSHGKLGLLFLFCLLSYLFPSLLSGIIGRLGGDIGMILSQFVSAFLSLYVVVFSFRFYQLYRALPR